MDVLFDLHTYVLGVNRIGREGDYDYDGASMLIAPTGEWCEPGDILIAPDSRYGEKIKLYEMPLGQELNGTTNLKQRVELADYWDKVRLRKKGSTRGAPARSNKARTSGQEQ